jgi:hypothetical protein
MNNSKEKKAWTTEDVHKRLQVVEIVVFLSLVLNAVQGYFTIHNHNQVNQLQEQAGQR